MTIAKDFASKFAVAFVAIAMIFSLVAPAVNAAETTEDLQKTINDLLAQVAALQGQLGEDDADTTTSSASCESIPAPLTMGSQGASVTALQNRLIADGQTIAAGATGYFGAQTKAALAAWQAANNVSPAAGYYGPITMAAMDAACVPADEDEDMDDEDSDDDSSSDLSGEASLDSFEIDSASDDEIEEGSEDAEIGEVTVEFADGDASISRIDVALVGSGDEQDPWDTFETISLWVDGEMVADMAADDEDDYLNEDDGVLRFSGLDIVAMEDEELDITIAATVQGSVDGSDDGEAWTVSVNSIRFFDADGVATTENEGPTATIDSDENTVSFTVEEAGSEDEIMVKTSSEDPSSTTLQLEDDKKSDWYTVFAFDLDTKDSVNDISLNTVEVNVATTGATYAALVDDAELVIDGTTIDDVTVTGGNLATLSFDVDGDVEIEAGERVTAELKLRFKALATEGATVRGSITTDNVGADVIDAEGADDLSTGQITGAATGDVHTLRTSGAILEVTDVSETLKANTDSTLTDDEGVFVIEFDVTAFESDIYIDDNATRGTVESNTGVNYTILVGGTATTAGTAVATLDSDAELEGGTRFLVEEGSTETFTLTVEYDPNITGSYKVQLYSVNFNETNDDADTQQLATPTEDYDTGSLTI